MQRRDFLKLSAAAGAVSCVTACGSKKTETVIPEVPVAEKINWSSCTCNCGHSCPLKVVTRDGKIARIESDDLGDDSWESHQSRACAKGRSTKKKVYAADRLKVPMKRVGKRGEGNFREISWEEAFDTIAAQLRRVIDTYGNESVYCQYASGRLYSFFSGGHWAYGGLWGAKLLNILGGYLGQYNTYSSGQASNAGQYTFGGRPASGYAELRNSDLYLSFGHNPAETEMSGAGGSYALSVVAKGVETYVVDPRYSDTAVSSQCHWLAIRPGTDGALCEALAYEIITQGAADEAFLAKYCVGYDQSTLPASAAANSDYKSHILGQGPDGVVKTPEYAAAITGICAEEIRLLATKLIAAKAPFISQGLGVQRHACGEQAVRSILMLPLLLGKVGQSGTNTGFQPARNVYPLAFSPTGANPVTAKIPCFLWTDAVVRGEEMTATTDGIRGAEKLSANIKFIWNYAGNALINQHSDVNKTHEILQDESLCEFILVHDVQMTPSAKYADILLPDLTDAEGTDISANSATEAGVLTAMTSSVNTPFSAKGCFEVCLEIAKRLGVEQEYAEGKNYQQWLESLYNEVAVKKGYPNYDELVKMGIYRVKDTKPVIGLKSYIDDPVASPLSTPSGKIEVYSETLDTMSKTWTLNEGDEIPAIPKYIKTWEGFEDLETKKQYPLQLIGHHAKGRTHSSFHSNPWMREAVEDAVWMNPKDAAARGISQGDEVLVTSLRGKLKVRARVTPRIMPGVTSLPQGAWTKKQGDVDVGGCVNALTSQRPTAIGKCNPQHTNLVEISLY
ncbi:anaerobic dimethyl sulfoxide reductase, A subunit, DmsA/YnfE family protein [Shewanella sediminis HAW-EB3]|uniref:Anaerobic dimethyl sulfoxide reductase, A subunit, DmsA/YnfE family protein n=1 Tax=Shewanella sediminis (strain HAW-EB3) TaxID=425104 RepID=A8FT42_SHESH|nr:DMSO/selenate family reductase complex A subunit [Shewanella sediminis]ABV36015.1 anaerobic dimethyl sulfoxide reductase, A subunit, DmsA/YnfE family protein [Shewanella sediminis HAW-EB3]